MLEAMYSIPLGRAVTLEEVSAAHRAARKDAESYFNFVRTYLPIRVGAVDSRTLAKLNAGFLPGGDRRGGVPESLCFQTVERAESGDSGHFPPVFTSTVKQIKAEAVGLGGPLRSLKKHYFQRRAFANPGKIVGGLPHYDTRIDDGAYNGHVTLFANMIDNMVTAEAGIEPQALALHLLNLEKVDYRTFKKIIDEVDRERFKGRGARLALARKLGQKYGWHRLPPNTYYLVFDGIPHHAGTLKFWQRQKLRRAKKPALVGTLNIDTLFKMHTPPK